MRWLMSFGMRRLFTGARTGRPGMAGLGAALTILGWLRNRRPPGEELVYRRDLQEGETIRVRLVRDAAVVDETDVEG